MNKLFDLRFVIGLFFSIVGILLLGYGFLSAKIDLQEVNLWCGGIFVVFGAMMIFFSFRNNSTSKDDSE